MNRYLRTSNALLLLTLFCLREANADPSVFTTESEFLDAITDAPMVLDFEDVDTGQGSVEIGGEEFSDRGFIFSSPLTGDLGKLFVEPAESFYDSNYLSVDRRPFSPGEDGNEDDLTVEIMGTYRAVGIGLVDAGKVAVGESITVYGSSGVIYVQDQIPANYFGIIADEAITRIVIDELALDKDDIAYDNFALAMYIRVDSDFDGFTDDIDNCPDNFNPDQGDLDGDGVGNVCDSDNDNDGIPDLGDNCLLTPNPGQEDSDGDQFGDACDTDDDDDGIPDESDTCPLVPNLDQRDTDNDGLGDSCDPDLDDDGVLNDQDNCLSTPNADQADSDGDGVGDACANAGKFVRGDANGDVRIDIADAVFMVAYLFQGRTHPPCMDAADANDSGAIDVSDPIYEVSYLFLANFPPPPVPFPEEGVDPTADDLDCDP